MNDKRNAMIARESPSASQREFKKRKINGDYRGRKLEDRNDRNKLSDMYKADTRVTWRIADASLRCGIPKSDILVHFKQLTRRTLLTRACRLGRHARVMIYSDDHNALR